MGIRRCHFASFVSLFRGKLLTSCSHSISLTHLGQTLVVPVILASQANAKLELLAILLPGTVYAISNHFFLAPRRKAKRSECVPLSTFYNDYLTVHPLHVGRRRRTIQDRNDEHISMKRREAEDAVLLLSDVAKRRTSTERERNGTLALAVAIGLNGFAILGLCLRDICRFGDFGSDIRAYRQRRMVCSNWTRRVYHRSCCRCNGGGTSFSAKWTTVYSREQVKGMEFLNDSSVIGRRSRINGHCIWRYLRWAMTSSI